MTSDSWYSLLWSFYLQFTLDFVHFALYYFPHTILRIFYSFPHTISPTTLRRTFAFQRRFHQITVIRAISKTANLHLQFSSTLVLQTLTILIVDQLARHIHAKFRTKGEGGNFIWPRFINLTTSCTLSCLPLSRFPTLMVQMNNYLPKLYRTLTFFFRDGRARNKFKGQSTSPAACGNENELETF